MEYRRLMKIFVRLDKTHFKPGSLVTGSVFVQLKEKTQANNLTLQLKKVQTVRIFDKESPSNDTDSSRVVYKKEAILHENLELSSGEHIFPFKFLLKRGDFASTKTKGYFGSMYVEIENIYTVTGICNMEQSKPHTLMIYQTNKVDNPTSIVLVRSNMLCNIKRHSFDLEINKVSFLPGDILQVEIKADSKKLKKIGIIKFKLFENFIYCNKLMRSRLLTETTSTMSGDVIKSVMRLPVTTAATCTESEFEIQIILEAEITYHKQKLKAKKYLSVRGLGSLLPEIEEHYALQAINHQEKVACF